MSATADIQAKYLACYEDPRTIPGFPDDYYPAERNGDARVPEDIQQAKARFKAVYAHRNACLRGLSGLQPGDPDRSRLMRQIILLTDAIDHLEDVYAPIGFIAEPVMDDAMFATELIFTHAPLANTERQPCESSFSLYIAISLEAPQVEEDLNGS